MDRSNFGQAGPQSKQCVSNEWPVGSLSPSPHPDGGIMTITTEPMPVELCVLPTPIKPPFFFMIQNVPDVSPSQNIETPLSGSSLSHEILLGNWSVQILFSQ